MKKNSESDREEILMSEAQLLENSGNDQIAYDSVILPARNLSVFGSKLSMKIINELVKEPGCAMDIARAIGEHEQKIYYHLRRLEQAGVIKLKAKEKRYGMTAKIFKIVSPVVSAKLHDSGREVKTSYALKNPKIEKMLSPFIQDGKLNARIIIGDPYPHGEYDSGGKCAVHVFDFISIIGKFAEQMTFPIYKLDTFINKDDLKENLILIGNVKDNTIINKINKDMPIYFDVKESEKIISKTTKKIYHGPRMGLILKMVNPFNKKKRILVLGGLRTRGVQAANIAFTQLFEEMIKGKELDDHFYRIFEGFDKSGNAVIDSVRFLE